MSIETCVVCHGKVNTDQSVMAWNGSTDIYYHHECRKALEEGNALGSMGEQVIPPEVYANAGLL